jgi:4-azaleucine resistance transporter AzlC
VATGGEELKGTGTDTAPPTRATSSREGWQRGLVLAAPIVLGYVPIGFAYGILAQKAGLSTFSTLLMSLLVYAGSSQLIAVGLFAAGSSAWSIIVTTFVVNLRHMLMSAAVSPYLERWRQPELAAFAYQLTDETFAVHSARFASGTIDKPEAFTINVTAQVAWIVGGWLGTVAGQLVTDVKSLALDYALPAMFVALLVLQTKDRVQIGVALLAGVMAVGLSLAGMDQWTVIAATLAGATCGVLLEEWIKKRSS